ncbi:ATP-dependent sacrificial sulfur transferase LarE [Bacteroidota bacterium]
MRTINPKEKLLKLQGLLNDMGEVTVAYSGGVDSTFLLKVAADTLKTKCLGVLAVSPTFPSREYERAIETAKSMDALVQIIYTHELDDDNFVKNPVNRCYFCKSELFDSIAMLAEEERFNNFVDGSNMDDLGDHRPGMKALKERGVRSPLQEAGLTKDEIRDLSREMGLPTWNKDALACLSSRFPYGEKINREKLKMVDQAENYLTDLGFRYIRARHKEKTVNIEVDPGQVPQLLETNTKERVEKYLRSIGYDEIIIDPEGYRQGKLNEKILKE